MTVTNAIIQLRRDTAANWTTNNPILNPGECGVELDTRKFKFGDGVSNWHILPYATQGNSGGLFISGSSLASPNLITAGGGISIANVSREYQFVKGNPGAVVVSASPMIQAGTTVGQELVLEGTDNTSTVTLPQAGAGVDLNGTLILKSGSRCGLIWNGSKWGELYRK